MPNVPRRTRIPKRIELGEVEAGDRGHARLAAQHKFPTIGKGRIVVRSFASLEIDRLEKEQKNAAS